MQCLNPSNSVAICNSTYCDSNYICAGILMFYYWRIHFKDSKYAILVWIFQFNHQIMASEKRGQFPSLHKKPQWKNMPISKYILWAVYYLSKNICPPWTLKMQLIATHRWRCANAQQVQNHKNHILYELLQCSFLGKLKRKWFFGVKS